MCSRVEGVVYMCVCCDIVERLVGVIHKASTQIGASILFPGEMREREREKLRQK